MSNSNAGRSAEKEAKWECPSCVWAQRAHPRYGWAAHDARAVDVHQSHLCPNRANPPEEASSD